MNKTPLRATIRFPEPKSGTNPPEPLHRNRICSGNTCGNHREPASSGWWEPCVPLGTRNHPAAGTAVVGLTGGQWFVVAVLLLVFVVYVIVLPSIRRMDRQPMVIDREESHQRLMREIRHHRDDG